MKATFSTLVNAALLATGATVPFLIASWQAPALAITFTANSGTRLASADFSVSSSNLIVTLTNTSTADVLVPTDVLTAVFFNLPGNPTLTRVSALLANGSTVFYDPDGQPARGVVGGEWAYKTGLSVSTAPNNPATQGISSVGLGLFGPPDRFPGPDLQSPTSPNGLQYGLLSAGDNSATGNGGVTGSGGLIKNSVVFTLSGLPTGFNPDSITDVSFQYGTDLSEPRIPGNPPPPGGNSQDVPEPSTTIALGLLTLSSFGLIKRGKIKQG